MAVDLTFDGADLLPVVLAGTVAGELAGLVTCGVCGGGGSVCGCVCGGRGLVCGLLLGIF